MLLLWNHDELFNFLSQGLFLFHSNFPIHLFLLFFHCFIFVFVLWIYVVQNLSKIACNRLQKELTEWQASPPVGFNYKVSDNLQRYYSFHSQIYISQFFILIDVLLCLCLIFEIGEMGFVLTGLGLFSPFQVLFFIRFCWCCWFYKLEGLCTINLNMWLIMFGGCRVV